MKRTAQFKDRLNEALNMRNMKAADLHRRTGISESTISQYRSGYAEPKKKKLGIIATALDVNPAWLMGLEVESSVTDKRHISASYDMSDQWEKLVQITKRPIDDSVYTVMSAYESAEPSIQKAVRIILGIEK